MFRFRIGLKIIFRCYLWVQAFMVLSLVVWQAFIYKQAIAAANNTSWEAGRLDYGNGSAEVAAFVNQENVQLQVVLCSLNAPAAYRLTLLLSKTPKISGLIPATVLVDGTSTSVYAEVSGNSIELQVSIPLLISLTYSPNLEIVFNEQDAKALDLPETLQISMDQADLALNEIARSCTLLCQDQGFSCNQPLLSGILWPRQGFDHEGDRSELSVGAYRKLLGGPKNNAELADGYAEHDDNAQTSVEDALKEQGSATAESTEHENLQEQDSNWEDDDFGATSGFRLDDESAEQDSFVENADSFSSSDALETTAPVNLSESSEKTSTKSSESSRASSSDASKSTSTNSSESLLSSMSSVKGNSEQWRDFDYKEQDETTSQETAKAHESDDESNEDDLSQDALNFACLQWPRSMSGYERSISDMYALTPSFNLSKKCKALLDKRFERDGRWALSFMPTIFKKPDSAYQKYQKDWNVLVKAIDPEGKLPDTLLHDDDYYLALFTLFTTTNLHEFPQSYFDLLNFSDDPATFLYAMDNRYDLETVKYYAVLERRLKGSISLLHTASRCYNIWEEFYQEFSSALPPIPKAQALRPIVYRQMLMRVWRLAGYPDPLHLRPQYAFVQGTNHRTITREPLEAKCSAFEGSNGDQFFFASSECIQGIYSDLKRRGMLNDEFKQVQLRWDEYAQACNRSKMLKLSGGTSQEVSKSGLALSLISLYKVYGFGDYFLLRNCLSTRDNDICAFQYFKSHQDYNSEFRNTLSTLSEGQEQDAFTLNQLNDLWRRYFESLKTYTEHLVARGRIEDWRAYFVQGVAITTQTETLMSGPYFRQPVEPEE